MSKTKPTKKLCLDTETLRRLDTNELLDVAGGALWSALIAAGQKAQEKTIVCPSAGGNCQSALANCVSLGGKC
jgi:hypothetical protein